MKSQRIVQLESKLNDQVPKWNSEQAIRFQNIQKKYFSFYSICQVCIILAFYFSQFNRLIVIISFQLEETEQLKQE